MDSSTVSHKPDENHQGIRVGIERAAAGARASDTPFISFFMPDEMLEMAREAGFTSVSGSRRSGLALVWVELSKHSALGFGK